MSEPAGEASPPPLRIGTAERNAAMAALDAHLEAGRLDPMEYGDRSAKVVDARTADDLRPLFVDLPAPHPELPERGGHGVTSRTPAPLASTPSSVPATDDGAPPATREPGGLELWGPRIARVMPFVALALFLTVPGGFGWMFFLLIPAAGILFAGTRGHRDDHPGNHDGWHDGWHDHHRRHRGERGDDRER